MDMADPDQTGTAQNIEEAEYLDFDYGLVAETVNNQQKA